MKTYIAVGYPDEENFNMKDHQTREEWQFQARDKEEAEKKAFEHFWYFHEVGVWEM